METQKSDTSENVAIETDDDMESDGTEDKIMHYKIEQVLVLRKTLHDVVAEEKLEIPSPFRQNNNKVTDKKGFFIIFGIIVLVCFLIFTHFSLQSPDTNLEQIFGIRRNVSDYYHQNLLYNLTTSWWKFLLNIIITIALCAVVFCLVICFPAAVLRFAVFFAVMFFAVSIPASWALVAMGANITAIICIIVVTVPSFFIISFAARYCYSYIHLTANLYKEAAKIVLAMPGLILLLFMAILLQLIIMSFFITAAALSIAIDSSSLLFLNIVVTNWALYFVEGFHCMVTAGSVASWYNTGYDQPLNSHISKSLSRTAKYHIGTIAFGSFLHPSITVVRAIAKVLSCNFSDHLPNKTTLNPEFRLIPFSKKYAYVMSAMLGTSYIESGREAFSSFYSRTPLFITLKEGADLTSLAIKVNLLFYPTGISCFLFWGSNNFWLATIQCLFTNIIIIAAFLETIETAAHAILTNFTEDELLRKYFSITFTKKTAILSIR